MRYVGRYAVAILCVLALAASTAGANPRPAKRGHVNAAAKKHAARKKLVTIRKQIVEKRAVLQTTKRRQRKVSEDIRENEENLHSAQGRLRETRSRLAFAERDLRDARARLADARKQLAGHIGQLRVRLVDVYKHGSVSYASVLLGSSDVWDLTSRGYMLGRVVRHDVDLVEQIKAEKAEIEKQTLRLSARRNDVARLRTATECHVATVTGCLGEQRELREELSRDRARLEAALAELAENSHEVERMLRAFEARPDIARRIPQPWVGSFARPVSGRISSRFGMRFHPILRVTKLHTGVDIAASSGTPIAAAGDGVVVHAGWWGGYGNCVVIAHGNGRSTLYGHCSSLAVGNGQRVRRGQMIGRVGSTGFSTGPHLHFEVRRNGTPVNPLSQ